MQEAVDFWLISFYLIGCNPIDLFFSEKPQDGNLNYARRKTGSHYSILIPPEAQPLISKYEGRRHLLQFCELNPDYDIFKDRVTTDLGFARKEL